MCNEYATELDNAFTQISALKKFEGMVGKDTHEREQLKGTVKD